MQCGTCIKVRLIQSKEEGKVCLVKGRKTSSTLVQQQSLARFFPIALFCIPFSRFVLGCSKSETCFVIMKRIEAEKALHRLQNIQSRCNQASKVSGENPSANQHPPGQRKLIDNCYAEFLLFPEKNPPTSFIFKKNVYFM